MISAKPFSGEEHLPFIWDGGPSVEDTQQGAVLLVHGFPGTPAEMRSLGRVLYERGWTVQGILLPGFGPQIETLVERRPTEWVAATREALAVLQRKHNPVLLIGYSMGAAISLLVAAVQPPTGVILLAPFWQTSGPRWLYYLWPVLKLIFPHFRPFAKANFTDPKFRRGVTGFWPEADLDDPEVQERLRHFRVPASFVDQLRQLGRTAYRRASEISSPTLVIQGTQDEVVKPHFTRQLVQQLGSLLSYQEVLAGHDLLDLDHSAWSQVEGAVLNFVDCLDFE